MREYEKELENEVEDIIQEHLEDLEEYKELCVEMFELALEDEPEAMLLIESFKSFGATDLQARLKTIKIVLVGSK